MKVCINTNSLKESSLSKAVEFISTLRCKAIELSTDRRVHVYQYINNPELFNIDLRDLEVIAVSGGWCDFAYNDYDSLNGQVQLCRRLRTDKLRIFATNPHKNYNYQEIFEMVVLNIQNQVSLYPDILFLFENHGGLTATGKNTKHLLEAVDLPNVGTVYDPTNYLVSGEDPVHALHQISNFIKHVHAKNWLDGEFSSVDKGEIDWKVIIRELKRIEFDGFLSIEYEGKGNPMAGLKSSFDYLNSLL